jgi:hypothetical protein
MAEIAAEIEASVRHLKQERDTWRALAQHYKTAFEEQTARFFKLQEICVATQAELENERLSRQRRGASSDSSLRGGSDNRGSASDHEQYGTADIIMSGHIESCCTPTRKGPDPSFSLVDRLANQRNYGTALDELDRLLRGYLTPEMRIQGLILQSDLLRKSDWLYDALAACSEAIDLVDRDDELRLHLPVIHYQRGVCYHQLGELEQALDALNHVCAGDDALYAKAAALRASFENQVLGGRRSAFEAHRSVTEGPIFDSEENSLEV